MTIIHIDDDDMPIKGVFPKKLEKDNQVYYFKQFHRVKSKEYIAREIINKVEYVDHRGNILIVNRRQP